MEARGLEPRTDPCEGSVIPLNYAPSSLFNPRIAAALQAVKFRRGRAKRRIHSLRFTVDGLQLAAYGPPGGRTRPLLTGGLARLPGRAGQAAQGPAPLLAMSPRTR